MYIKNNKYFDFPFTLDERYNTGTTYEDNINGKYVKLSEKQLDFKLNNPTASVKEVWDMRINIPTPEDELENARRQKLAELINKDEEINIFYINSQPCGWLNPEDRANFKNFIEAKELLGAEIINYVLGGVMLTLTPKIAKMLLAQLEAYAGDCAIITANIKSMIEKATTIDDISAITINMYPNAPNFTI
jgi:hypothetical protein